MATLVSTGQITIVDTNDARTITAVLIANGATQQIYTKDESTVTYVPSWFTTNLVITPSISIGGLTEAQSWASLSNKQFSLTAGGTALTTSSTSSSFVNNSLVDISAPFTVTHGAVGTSTASSITIKGNLKDTIGATQLYFDADFVDPNTLLVTHITCQITLSVVKTGSNAVFITLRGQTNIEQATGETKNNIAIAADLVRSSGIDNTGLTYKWYEDGGGIQITSALSNVSTKYGFKNTASGTSPSALPADLNQNIPSSAGHSNPTGTTPINTLIINETAVADIEIYKVEITDSDSKTYVAYFTVYDLSDPYDVRIISSTGDKLQNGQGNTTLTPDVFYGSSRVTPLTGWTFTWFFYDRNGKRGAFVDTSKISTAGGGIITANTTGNSAVFSCAAITAGMFAAGSIIKAVKPNGEAFFYEVASSAAGTVTIRAPITNTFLSFADYPAPSANTDFVNGRLFGCTTGGIRSTVAGASITLTGDEVDSKARILVEAYRP